MKTIAILGGSYASGGAMLQFRRFLSTLPTSETWRIVLIERNSHSNHLYVFPRYAVLPGHTHKAFIPYTNVIPKEEDGTSRHLIIHAQVVALKRNAVRLSRKVEELGGKDTLEFDYLLYILGGRLAESMDLWRKAAHVPTANPTPLGKPLAQYGGTKKEGIAWLERQQERIKAAQRILVVGGGALGVQTATDIASTYGAGAKDVTLLHSRDRLMPLYSQELHDEIVKQCQRLKVNLILGERLQSSTAVDGVVRTSKGREITTDLLLLCTGQTPNSQIMAEILPKSIDPSTSLIRVRPTMQVIASESASTSAFSTGTAATTTTQESGLASEELERKMASLAVDPSVDGSGSSDEWPHFFAAGDCADVQEIKSGNRAYYQAAVAARNIMRLIVQKYPSSHPESSAAEEPAELEFDPYSPLESHTPSAPAIKMTLGLRQGVIQGKDGKVKPKDDGVDDNHGAEMWSLMSASTDDLYA